MIEFYSDDLSKSGGWKSDLAEFSNFLSLVDDPAAARSMLLTLGVEANRADDLVGRYARDARRVLLDSRHQRDKYVLDIQQRLEAELTEEGLDVPAAELEVLVRRLVPTTSLAAALSINELLSTVSLLAAAMMISVGLTPAFVKPVLLL